MRKFIVTEGLLNAIAGYLQKCPYRKVASLLQMMNGLPDYKEPKPEGKNPAEEKQDGPAD